MLPVMLEDCYSQLANHEETSGLTDIFMLPLYRRDVVGLPITEQEGLDRLVDAIRTPASASDTTEHVYVSYTRKDAPLATDIARGLIARSIPAWVATRDIRLGDRWR